MCANPEPVDLSDLPTVNVDMDAMRRRVLQARLRETLRNGERSAPDIAEMSRLDPRTIIRARNGTASEDTWERIERALNGDWSPQLTPDYVDYMTRCLNKFLNRTQPIGAH